MAELFANGSIIDVVIGLTVFEFVLLAAYHRFTGRGIAPMGLLITLLSGLFLMVAIRIALTGGWWGWIGLCLTASLFAHVSDLARRWNR